MTLPVLVINRAVDRDRLEAFMASARDHGIDPVRVPAQDAHRPDFPFALHDDLIRDHFWGKPEIKPGAIGCFLSHRAAWQAVLDRGLDAALIAEDDIRFTDGVTRIEQYLNDTNGLDILFANSRLAGWAALASKGDAEPLPDAITAVARAGGPKAAQVTPTPGGDCYVVTRQGAARLLAETATMGIVCGVDWAMVWLSAGPVDVGTALPEFAVLKAHATPPASPLNAHILTRPIAELAGGPSAIRHSVAVPIADLVGRRTAITHTEYVAAITLGGSTLSFAGRSGPDPVMEAHRAGQIWDEPGLRLLLTHFPEGGTFVDVGAHIGNHAVVLARMGAARRVHAVEANAEMHRLLRTNCAINGVADRVILAEPGVALGMAEGTGWLLRNRRRSSETMVKAQRPDDAKNAHAVRIVAGDSLFGGEAVHAIKIDTSGSEVEVLRGFAKTLARDRPLVLVDHAEAGVDRIARLAVQHGMTIAATVPSSRKRRVSSLLIPSSGQAT